MNYRYLGLDVGTKRIGVAMSDPLFYTAQPYETINRQPETKSVENIKQICEKHNVTKIIVGLPKNMNGTLGPQAEDVNNFVDLLKKDLQIEFHYEDERLTSKQAEMFLIQQKKKPSKNKGLIDVASAAIILQQYLDKN